MARHSALRAAPCRGIFRNSLAEPQLIGVTGGAGLGAAIAIVLLGSGSLQLWMVPACAFVGGLAAMFAVLAIARSRGVSSTAVLILSGITINSVTAAAIGYLTAIADDARMRSITFWFLGSLGGASWDVVLTCAPFVVLGLALLFGTSFRMNVLLLGDPEAASLGVSPTALRRRVILGTGLAVGASVAFAGSVAFVGLLVPNLLRLWLGADHRALLPASALAGGASLVLADAVARTAIAPAELPVGIVTSFAGGLFFLAALASRRGGIVRA